MKLTKLKAAAMAAGVATMMASAALAADVKATMIIYLDPSVQFFNPVVKGAQDAAAQFGVDLDVQYANNDPVRQNDLIESATASGVDGIAVAISSSDAFDESICAAVKAGIIVIGFNNDDLDGAKGNCRQAYVGMDEFASGYELGNRMIKEFGLKSGDVVFNPREIPEASFAVARGGGIEKAMTDLMYEIPSDDKIGRVLVTEDVVRGLGLPEITYRTEEVRGRARKKKPEESA